MYTPSLLLALSLSVSAAPENLWNNNYWQAAREGQQANKPLAVFVGSGQDGYHQVAKEGAVNGKVTRLLQERYVTVFVNTSTPEGRKVAQDLGIRQQSGLVISNRTGNLMAYHHEGNLSEQDLVRNLERYSESTHQVSFTESGSNPAVGGNSCPGGVCSVGGGFVGTSYVGNCVDGSCFVGGGYVNGGCSTGTCFVGGGCYTGGFAGGCNTGGCFTGGCFTGGCYTGGCNVGCYSGGCGGGRRGGRCR